MVGGPWLPGQWLGDLGGVTMLGDHDCGDLGGVNMLGDHGWEDNDKGHGRGS